MDQITHDIRREQWASIIKECLASGMKKKTWCRANGISEKQFFYWQRKLRNELYQEAVSAPAVIEQSCPVVKDRTAFVELPVIMDEPATASFHPDVIIRSENHIFEISNSASDHLIALIGGIINVK